MTTIVFQKMHTLILSHVINTQLTHWPVLLTVSITYPGKNHNNDFSQERISEDFGYVKNSAFCDTKIVSLHLFSGYDPFLSYIYHK